MSFAEEIRFVWGPERSQDSEILRQDLRGRINWLWDPSEDEAGEKKYAHLLEGKKERKGCIKISNPNALEAFFYPIDKALIPEQQGGQCEGVIWYIHQKEQICWVEMKISTHNTVQFLQKLNEALSQIKHSIQIFTRLWEEKALPFLGVEAQQGAIAVPAKPRRLRQAPRDWQIMAKRKLGGIKVFVLSEIQLPGIKP